MSDERATTADAQKPSFTEALTAELNRQGATIWCTEKLVEECLLNAAADTLVAPVPEYPILRRVYEPDNLAEPITIVDLGDDEEIRLWPDDVRLLRALLLSWDECRPAVVGDTLTMATKLDDNRVVNEVVEEMLVPAPVMTQVKIERFQNFEYLRLTVPEWNKQYGMDQYTWFKIEDLPEILQELLEDDDTIRAYAMVNLDAERPEDLRFKDWEIE